MKKQFLHGFVLNVLVLTVPLVGAVGTVSLGSLPTSTVLILFWNVPMWSVVSPVLAVYRRRIVASREETDSPAHTSEHHGKTSWPMGEHERNLWHHPTLILWPLDPPPHPSFTSQNIFFFILILIRFWSKLDNNNKNDNYLYIYYHQTERKILDRWLYHQ